MKKPAVIQNTKKFFITYRVPIVVGASIGVAFVIRQHSNEIARIHAEAEEAKKILTLIWETYQVDPELANNAAVCNVISHH